MTFLFFLRFTKHICGKQNMLQQQLKKLVRTKTLKAQTYMEITRIYTESSPQSNELLLLDAFRRVLA